MKVTLLGTGGPLPDPRRHGSCVIVETASELLMFDAGRGAVMQATRAGIRLDRIDPIFITHHHYDHISDLGDLLISSWLEGRRSPLHLYGPPGTHHIVQVLFEQVYAKDVRFRTEGERAWGDFPHPSAKDIGDGYRIETPTWTVVTAEVEHNPTLNVPALGWHALGFRIEADGKSLCISGDTVQCEGLIQLASRADVLVQCAYLAESELTNPHLRSLATHTLASAKAAGEIAAEAKVGTLVLTHLRRKPDELLESMVEDVRRTYSGRVILGRDLLSLEI